MVLHRAIGPREVVHAALLIACWSCTDGHAIRAEPADEPDAGINVGAPRSDAAFDNPGPLIVAEELSGCDEGVTPTLHNLGLEAAYDAAFSACRSSLELRDCEDGVCPVRVLTCGAERFDFGATGCLARYVGMVTDEGFIAELSRCMVEEMADACMPCAAGATIETWESCTD